MFSTEFCCNITRYAVGTLQHNRVIFFLILLFPVCISGHFLVFEYLSCRLRLSAGYTFTTASTPPFRCPSSSASCSMTFYYSMNGNYVGNLSVRTDDQELLYLAGDQGTGNGWLGATVNASFSKNETIQVL